MTDFPPELAAAIAARLEGISRKELAARAAQISETYRGGAGTNVAISDRKDALAYVLTRMPATYAATAAALAAFSDAVPHFQPRSLTDVGAGPGTASFAATAQWPSLDAVVMIDESRAFSVLAGELTGESSRAALANASRILGDATRLGRELPKADLVLAAYALAEVSDVAMPALVESLWRAADGALILVEPGMPQGFERIRAARKALIAAGATIAAPCPHQAPCPIVSPDWCHFAVRVARSREHRLAKGAEAPFEDEKFSYVAAIRGGDIESYKARVLAPPRVSKAGISMKLCTDAGVIAEETVAKRDAEAFRRVRRAWWGDALRG